MDRSTRIGEHSSCETFRDYEMRPVSGISRDEIHAVKDRFTAGAVGPRSFNDMSVLLGDDGQQDAYLGHVSADHGGNATPAWLVVAYWIYRAADAKRNQAMLSMGGVSSTRSYCCCSSAIAWRTFGAPGRRSFASSHTVPNDDLSVREQLGRFDASERLDGADRASAVCALKSTTSRSSRACCSAGLR